MWYRFATDQYDLEQLNNDVRIDDAYNDIMRALYSGESLDLSDRGFKGIKVVPYIPEMEEEEEIDVHNPRKEGQYNKYDGISLDHFQGIAFASQALKRDIKKAIPTLNYIQSTYYPTVKFDIEQKLNENINALENLDENAINQMIRQEDIDKAWKEKKHNNIPVWSGRNPENFNYQKYLQEAIDFENNWCKQHVQSFWQIWHSTRRVMLDFLHYIPHPSYKQLWLELIPI